MMVATIKPCDDQSTLHEPTWNSCLSLIAPDLSWDTSSVTCRMVVAAHVGVHVVSFVAGWNPVYLLPSPSIFFGRRAHGSRLLATTQKNVDHPRSRVAVSAVVSWRQGPRSLRADILPVNHEALTT